MAIRRTPSDKMKKRSYDVLMFMKDHDNEDYTVEDIATALNLSSRQANGIVTMCMQNVGLSYREEHEIELADGSHKKVKFVRLTDLGREYEPSEITD